MLCGQWFGESEPSTGQPTHLPTDSDRAVVPLQDCSPHMLTRAISMEDILLQYGAHSAPHDISHHTELLETDVQYESHRSGWGQRRCSVGGLPKGRCTKATRTPLHPGCGSVSFCHTLLQTCRRSAACNLEVAKSTGMQTFWYGLTQADKRWAFFH